MNKGILKNRILKDSWKYILILLLASIPIFQHLGSLPIRLYDEARLASNAYEMYHSGFSFITTSGGDPDMWNTKPPLLIWLQVLSMKVAGVNETGLRLPSAFAAFFTCVLLLLLAVRYMKNFWLGFIWVLVLITSSGYFDYHAVRFAEYDALLTFFLTLGAFTFFLFLETSKKKYVYLFFMAMALAVLTKSAAALMILPGFFIYAAIKKKLLFLLKNRDFYIGLLIFLILAGGYYILREIYNPGYLMAVWQNEFGGRFLETIEGYSYNFWYYYENLISTNVCMVGNRFKQWILLIPCGVLVGMCSKDARIKNLTLFSTVVAVTYFLVISSAQTKCFWYDLPLYPFFAIIVGVFIHFVFTFLKEEKRISHYLKFNIVPYIFLFLIFIMPYKEIVNRTYKPKEYPQQEEVYRINYFIRDIFRGNRQWDNFSVIYDGYAGDLWFYIHILNEKGKNITITRTQQSGNRSRRPCFVLPAWDQAFCGRKLGTPCNRRIL